MVGSSDKQEKIGTKYYLSEEELNRKIDLEIVKEKLNNHTDEYRAQQRRIDDVLNEIFAKLSRISDNQKEFPLHMSEYKNEVEDVMRRDYITKTELRTMLRTAMYIAGVAVAIINGVFVWAVTQHTLPQQQTVLMQELMVEFKKEIEKREYYDKQKISPRK